MIANPERGEVEVTMEGDTTRPLRPSYEAMKAIEMDTGQTLTALFAKAYTDVGLTLNEIEAILYHGMVAAGKDRDDPILKSINRQKIGKMAFDTGVLELRVPLGLFLANALNGGRTVSKSTKKKSTPKSSRTKK